MLSLSLTAGSTTAGTAIGITKNINTNNNLTINNNDVQVLQPGVYEIVGEATVTSSAANDYGLAIYVNGNQIGNSSINDATGASETSTVPIYGIINIVSTSESDYATINFIPVGAPAIVGGLVSIKKLS